MTAQRVTPINLDVRKNTELIEKARKSFLQHGESVTSWALSRGYNPNLVAAVLSGRLPCTRGQAHKIAVELGLKPASEAA
jgi:gp16 family phage-associated protein